MQATDIRTTIQKMIAVEETARLRKLKAKDHASANIHGDRETVLRELFNKIEDGGGFETVLSISDTKLIGRGEMITQKEAAALLGRSSPGVGDLIHNGFLTAVREGKNILISRAAVLELKATGRKRFDAVPPAALSDGEPVLRTREVAALMGVSDKTVELMAQRKRLAAFKFRGKRFYRRSVVNAAIAARKEKQRRKS